MTDQTMPTRRRTYREDAVQGSIVSYIRLVAPDCLLFAIPNGGLRSRTEAARMKKTGTLRGAPDLVFIGQGVVVGLEVKAGRGRLTPEQMDIAKRWQALGHSWHLVRSIDDVRDALVAAGIRTRDRAKGGAP